MIGFFCLLLFFSIIIPTSSSNRNPTKVRSHHRRFPTPQRSLQSSLSSSFSTAIAKLTAINGDVDNYFGDVNAVSISNNRIVVGAYGYDNELGAVYLFGDPNDPFSGAVRILNWQF
jgi:hypothetical protein